MPDSILGQLATLKLRPSVVGSFYAIENSHTFKMVEFETAMTVLVLLFAQFVKTSLYA